MFTVLISFRTRGVPTLLVTQFISYTVSPVSLCHLRVEDYLNIQNESNSPLPAEYGIFTLRTRGVW